MCPWAMASTELAGNRARIRQLIHREPGLRISDVAQRLGVHPSTAEYHLRQLVRAGIVTVHRDKRQVHHYPTGRGWCQRAQAIHAACTEAARRGLELALEAQVVSQKALVDEGVSRSATRWAIEVLVEAGGLEKVAWGVYMVPAEHRACAQAALDELPCQACNPDLATGLAHRR